MLETDRIAEIFFGIARVAPTDAQIAAYADIADEETLVAAVLADEGAAAARVARFYQVYFNRLPEDGGLTFWTGVVRDDPALTDRALAAAFFAAGEYTALYGGLGEADAVRALYENVLGREADQAGFDFWFGLVEDPDNGFGIDDLGRQFANAPETVASFALLTGAYLGGLALGQPGRETLFDYAAEAMKTLPETSFTADLAPPEIAKGAIPDTEQPAEGGRIAGGGAADPVVGGQAAALMALDAFRADARFAGIDGSGITIAVIDSGIDFDHPAFGPVDGDGTGSQIVFTRDFRTGQTPFEQANSGIDGNGHGTHVAAIAAGLPYTAAGGASFGGGVAPGAEIVALRVTEDDGTYAAPTLERALRWVVDNAGTYGIDVVNMSLGGGLFAEATLEYAAEELAALQQLGIIVVAAAGNSYLTIDQAVQAGGLPPIARGAIGYPAADPTVIAVGALYEDAYATGAEPDYGKLPGFRTEVGDIAVFSQRSTAEGLQTIFAPGAQILSALPDGRVGNLPGTSMAAPQIAGIAALAQQLAVRELGRPLTPDEFGRLLHQSATTVRDLEFPRDAVTNTGLDYGRANVQALAEAVVALAAPRPQPEGDTVPGDATTTATLALGQAVSGAVETARDQDWYAVQLTGGQRYEFALQGRPSGAGTLSDPLVRIFDVQGTFLAGNDDGGTGLESLLRYEAPYTGTFYVSARAYMAATGTYQLSGLALATLDDAAGSVATTASVSAAAGTGGAIEAGGDLDWYRLEVEAGLTYTVTLAGADGQGGTLEDPVIRVLDEAGTVIARNDDGTTRDATAVFTAAADGVLYLEAGAAGAGDTGTYALSVTAEEIDDIPGDATSLATVEPGGTLASAIEIGTDADWIGADLVAGGSYTLTVAGASGRPDDLTLDDPILALIDPDGFVLAVADDGGDTLDPALTFVAPIDGRYFFGVEGFYADSTGTYELALSEAESIDVAGDLSTTGTIAPEETVTGLLEVAGDWDWYALELVEGEVIDVGLFGAGANFGTLADPYLRVYDDEGTLLLEDDDGAGAFGFGPLDAGLSIEVLETGTYYVEAASFFDEGEGTYSLIVAEGLFV